MRPFPRILIVACSLLIVAQALALCAATGWRTFTRFPQPEIEEMNRSTGLYALFEGTGAFDNSPAAPNLDNRFALGLIPYPAFGVEAISVLTVAGPAALVALAALLARRRANPRSGPQPSTSAAGITF